MPAQNLTFGAWLLVTSELFLVLSGAIIKQFHGTVSTEQIVFFRNVFGLILLLPWLAKNGISTLHTQCLSLHFTRALIGVIAMLCFFYSWAHLPLAQAALLKQTSPFFIPIVAFFWVNETFSWRTGLAILLGFIGVILILNPWENDFLNLGVLAGLTGAILAGSSKTSIRKMRATEPAQRIVFYFAAFATLLSIIPAILHWLPLTWTNIAWLALLSSLATIAQLLLTMAYGYAPAGQLGAFTYSSVIFAALLGWLLWNESIHIIMLCGMAIIISAGLLTMLGQQNITPTLKTA